MSTAFEMIDENGVDAFSVRRLASSFGVQVSSLYNHIENEDDLLLEVAKRAAVMYSEFVASEVEGLELEESTIKAGEAFRVFFHEHKYLYELLLDSRWIKDPDFDEAIQAFTQPIYVILDQYGIKDPAAMDHLYVMMRVVTHGFSSLNSRGVFDGLSVDPVDSYHMMIKSVIEMMKAQREKTET